MNALRSNIESGEDQLRRFGHIVATDLRSLARLHLSEPDAKMLKELRQVKFPDCLGLRTQTEQRAGASALLADAIAQASLDDSAHTLTQLAADYADIYLLHALRASPEESVWFNDEGCMRQEQMFQVRDWYERYGLQAGDWRVQADDHLVTQLAFVSHLIESGDLSIFRAAAQFLDEHLLRWIEQFARRVANRCATQYFAGLASLTACYLNELRVVLSTILDEPRPTTEEIDLRMRPRTEPKPQPVVFHQSASAGPTW